MNIKILFYFYFITVDPKFWQILSKLAKNLVIFRFFLILASFFITVKRTDLPKLAKIL